MTVDAAVADLLHSCDERFYASVRTTATMLDEQGATRTELLATLLRYGADYLEWREDTRDKLAATLRRGFSDVDQTNGASARGSLTTE